MANILITGAEGFFGKWLVPLLRETDHHLLLTTHRELDITQVSVEQIDYINKFIDILINLAAYTNVGSAETNKEQAFRVNADCLDWLNLEDTDVFHMSTDYVYSGDEGYSTETDLLKPFCIYGESKAAGDTRLLSYCNPNIHIIRTSFKPIRWPHPVAFDDMITNADTVDIIAGMVCRFILSNPPGGVFNIGTEPKTIFELARRNNPGVKPSSVKDIPFLKPDVSMNLNKYNTYMRQL